ncbi:hypothetical protein BDR06DRAFT_1054827 [Suillus hirtellus]|nr:hypothetical protein BDR06DRAFT_1054827 [Suillus hirtellus]
MSVRKRSGDDVVVVGLTALWTSMSMISRHAGGTCIHFSFQWSHPARSRKTVASIIESLQWTVVLIPVLVIMELDGLSSNPSKLGEAAQEAIAYITSLIHSHSASLKVQATT